jgi:hypothetical protein
MVLHGLIVKQIKLNYPINCAKEHTMIGLAQFFHATHTGTDHIFFSDLIHTKLVDVEDYELLIEQDLVSKIVHILISELLCSKEKI